MRVIFLAFALLLAAPAAMFAQQGIEVACTTPNDRACVDWNKGVAYAVGIGAPPPGAGAASNPLARRAARIDGARNLLELIQGVNLDSTTSLKNAMAQSDTVTVNMNGVLQSLREVGQPKYFSDRTVQIKVSASLRAVVPAELVYGDSGGAPRMLEAPGSVPVGGMVNPAVSYSGLIIDARGTGVLPAMAPKVFDPDGREVYGSAYVSREWAVTQGVVGYVKTIEAAREDDRVKGSPATVKAVEAKGANKADLVISKTDADTIRAIAQRQNFLSEGRVMVVLD